MQRLLESYLNTIIKGIVAIQNLKIENPTITEILGLLSLLSNRGQSIYFGYKEKLKEEDIEILEELKDNIKAYSSEYIDLMTLKRIEEYSFRLGFEVQNEEEKYVIKKNKKYWKIVYEGKEIVLPDLKGLSLITFLIQKSPKEYSPGKMLKESGQRPDLNLSSPEYIFDGKTTKELKNAIKDIEERLKYEEDVDKREEYSNKRLEVGAYLDKSMSQTGKSRKMSDSFRVSVVQQYSRILKEIEKAHPELHSHFISFLKMGEICCYRPDKEINWLIL